MNTSNGGVPKRAVAEAAVTTLGLIGDVQKNRKYHGGPLQALLLISAEDIEALKQDGWPVFFGALGENITTRGLDYRAVRHGQRFRLGTALIEITKRRTPCATLDVYGPGIQRRVFDAKAKAGDFTTPIWGMAGFYAKVIEEGVLRPGDMVVLAG